MAPRSPICLVMSVGAHCKAKHTHGYLVGIKSKDDAYNLCQHIPKHSVGICTRHLCTDVISLRWPQVSIRPAVGGDVM